MCGLTAALGAFAHLGLPCPFGSGSSISQDQGLAAIINVLIYGSSTSLGLYAAQLVHLSSRVSGQRIRLIGIASPSRHDLLHHTPYNYDVLVDYRDPQMVDKIWEATNGRGIDYAMDCISERETVQKIDRSLGPRGRMVVFRTAQGGQYDVSKLRVKPFYCIVWVGLGVEVEYEG